MVDGRTSLAVLRATNAAALHDRMHLRTAWLSCGAFDASLVSKLAEEIMDLRLSDLGLVKAFDPRSGDDRFASPPALRFVCARESCGKILGTATTIGEAMLRLPAPFSARIATAGSKSATATEKRWVSEIDAATLRPFRDADVYVTSASASTSASFGWHIDDIDVLLVLLSGSKRFRVAGRALGSAPVIDHVMTPGDAIFIPAGAFHTGGQSTLPDDSILLSIAFDWATDVEAQRAAAETVTQWQQVRKRVLATLPIEQDSWDWAGSDHGRQALRARFSVGAAKHLTAPFMPQNIMV
eukprot:CAMPEP_0183339752 /NCGR_PEP_ID=MMETSP0164_2-20130417/6565_1 /TAXON_ID=221442 /ORGANISM="Coccolithus pelagicus ssp braarudi, Strain PLY182g" /LENGTH=296 /DNA_ID=CAMNT_0025509807 /DNA_START=27 /DNA_END=917 /DNA_ORIENTATION=+